MFSSTERTPEENLKLAIQYLDDLRKGHIDEYTDMNKASKLPKQIYRDGIGYRFQIVSKGITYSRSSCDPNMSDEDRLRLALESKNEYHSKYASPQEARDATKPKPSLPKYISIVKQRGKELGYKFSLSRKTVRYAKVFVNPELSMEEKLGLVTRHKDEYFIEHPTLLRAGSS